MSVTFLSVGKISGQPTTKRSRAGARTFQALRYSRVIASEKSRE